MWRVHYRPKNFPSVWQQMSFHVKRKELIAPREVFEELRAGRDDLFDFARKHKEMFVELDAEQIALVLEILSVFPKLIDANKTIPDADPYVIALAKKKGWSVVTAENKSNSPKKPKIPNVCQHYGIPCLSLPDFIADMKWKI